MDTCTMLRHVQLNFPASHIRYHPIVSTAPSGNAILYLQPGEGSVQKPVCKTALKIKSPRNTQNYISTQVLCISEDQTVSMPFPLFFCPFLCFHLEESAKNLFCNKYGKVL